MFLRNIFTPIGQAYMQCKIPSHVCLASSQPTLLRMIPWHRQKGREGEGMGGVLSSLPKTSRFDGSFTMKLWSYEIIGQMLAFTNSDDITVPEMKLHSFCHNEALLSKGISLIAKNDLEVKSGFLERIVVPHPFPSSHSWNIT